MGQLPDFTGYLCEDVERILKEANVRYVISETTSPRNDVTGDEKRVVRQVERDGVVQITFCRYE